MNKIKIKIKKERSLETLNVIGFLFKRTFVVAAWRIRGRGSAVEVESAGLKLKVAAQVSCAVTWSQVVAVGKDLVDASERVWI
jgi:hypothetical protein